MGQQSLELDIIKSTRLLKVSKMIKIEELQHLKNITAPKEKRKRTVGTLLSKSNRICF